MAPFLAAMAMYHESILYTLAYFYGIFLISPLLIRRLGRKAADRDAAASRVQRSLPEACSVVAV